MSDEAGRSEGSSLLAGLVEQVLQARQRGVDVNLDELAGGDEALHAELVEALARLDNLPDLFRSSDRGQSRSGELLGDRYQVEEVVGAGAMGIVHRARDLELKRDVAVKFLRRELAFGGGDEVSARFAREAQVLASIKARNVLTVFDRGETGDGQAFLVMELLEGASFVDWCESATLRDGDVGSGSERLQRFSEHCGLDALTESSDLRQLARWFGQVCEGLQAAHEVGVVHRDVKPSNLFIERGGRVVVLDFGIGSLSAFATIGQGSSPLGTPTYMSPEQVRGEAVDARTDVYGVAATLYHLIAAQPPFAGDVRKVMRDVERHEPPRLHRMRPGLPTDLVAVVEKGMSPRADDRYESVSAMGRDLAAWLDHRPVAARWQPWWRRAARRAARSAVVRTAAAVMLIAAAVIGVWQWQQHRQEAALSSWLAALGRVGPSLINDFPHTRATNAVCTSAHQRDALDEMVENGSFPGVSLALRSVHRLDAGDLPGAVGDVERLTALGESPFASKLLAMLRTEDADVRGLVSSEQPAVGSVGDRLLCAVHAMRLADRAPPWIGELLRDPKVDDMPVFADLRLLQSFRDGFSVVEDDQIVLAFRAIIDEVARLEAVRGTTSAILLHVQAASHIRIGRFIEAARVARRGCELCPDDYLFHLAHGESELRLGRGAEAIAPLARAAGLQPSSLRVRELQCGALLLVERVNEAKRVIADTPWHLSPTGDARRLRQLGFLDYSLAWLETRREEESGENSEASMSLFRSARDRFEAAGVTTLFQRNVCDYLLDEKAGFAPVLLYAARRSLNAERLLQIAALLPEMLGAEEIDALAYFFQAQAKALEGRPF